MKNSKKIIIIIALILMFGSKYFPSLLGINPIGMATLGIFVGTLILLIGVNLIWPVFLSMIAFAVNGIFPLNQIISSAFGNSIFWFMLINGVVIGVIEKTGLLRRIALFIACRPFTKKNPWLFVAAFLASCLICGSLMNTTAVCLLFFALAAEILSVLNVKKGDPFGIVLMTAVLVASNVSHALTPFGHSVTVLGINYFTDLQGVSFFQYSIVGYIAGILGLIAILLIMKFVFKFNANSFANFDSSVLTSSLGPMKKEEKISAVILAGVIIWWIFPTIIQSSLPDVYTFFNSQLGIVAPLFVALVLLCLISVNGEPLMNIGADIKTAPWGAGFPVAISMFLGSALQNPDAGIIDAVSTSAAPFCSTLSPIVFVMIVTLLILIMTQFTSCTLSVMVGGLIATTLMSNGAITGVHGGAMSIAMVLSAQAAYATAPASAPSAIFAGQGWSTPGRQIKDGFIYAFVWWIIALIAYFIASTIF